MPPKPKEVVKKLEKIGFVNIRQSGSHIIFKHPDGRQTYAAIHTKDLPEGTYRSILKQIGITKNEFEAK